MKLYKILDGLNSCHGGNHTWKLGEWLEVEGELFPCENGIHLCRPQDLIFWLHNDIYEAEYDGEIIGCEEKVVVRKARIIRHYDTWNDRTARLFAVWCARQVQHLIEDQRLLDALDIAERYANGKASEIELSSAWTAAWDAAWTAAWTAARAASQAIQDAAWTAAWDAAWNARAAAGNAKDAARNAQTSKLLEILEGTWP